MNPLEHQWFRVICPRCDEVIYIESRPLPTYMLHEKYGPGYAFWVTCSACGQQSRHERRFE
jgi:RNase P subunit RPR2